MCAVNPGSPFGVILARDQMVAMRDGVRLATDIYRPANGADPAPGRWPTVLVRFGYDKDTRFWVPSLVKRLVPEGYAVVVQDIRGRYASEGDYYHTVSDHEGPDGYDTVEWIAAQPWSDGRVGTAGVSLGSSVQSAMALHRPPHLGAMVLEDGPLSYFDNGVRQGGAMEMRSIAWTFYPAIDSREVRARPEVLGRLEEGLAGLRGLLSGQPFESGKTPLAVVPRFEAELLSYATEGSFIDYWKQDSLWYDDMERHADVPTLIRCGWYDSYSLDMPRYYQRLVAEHDSPTRLIMGPWIHGSPQLTYAGDADFGPDAAMDMDEVRLRFFDRWLRNDAAVGEGPPVRIFVMGGGSGLRNADGRLDHGGLWRDEQEWPLARTDYVSYFPHAGGELAPTEPTVSEVSLTFEYDPADPVPTISANASGFSELLPIPEGVRPQFVTTQARLRTVVAQGASDQRTRPGVFGAEPPYGALAERQDVLVFETAPLERAVEVTGPIVVNLWVSSSARDTDFTAKLVDVYPPGADYPDGYALALADSIQRARFREGYESEVLMEPEKAYQVAVELPPTSNLFAPGHRIRLDISSSNFPRFDPNPNTGEPIGRHTKTVAALNTVYLDSERPSHVVLPVIP